MCIHNYGPFQWIHLFFSPPLIPSFTYLFPHRFPNPIFLKLPKPRPFCSKMKFRNLDARRARLQKMAISATVCVSFFWFFAKKREKVRRRRRSQEWAEGSFVLLLEKEQRSDWGRGFWSQMQIWKGAEKLVHWKCAITENAPTLNLRKASKNGFRKWIKRRVIECTEKASARKMRQGLWNASNFERCTENTSALKLRQGSENDQTIRKKNCTENASALKLRQHWRRAKVQKTGFESRSNISQYKLHWKCAKVLKMIKPFAKKIALKMRQHWNRVKAKSHKFFLQPPSYTLH